MTKFTEMEVRQRYKRFAARYKTPGVERIPSIPQRMLKYNKTHPLSYEYPDPHLFDTLDYMRIIRVVNVCT